MDPTVLVLKQKFRCMIRTSDYIFQVVITGKHFCGYRVEMYMVEILEGILVPHEPQKSEHSKGQLLLYLVWETSHLNLDFQFSATMCEFGVVFVELTKTICRWFIGILWFVQCRIGCGKLCKKCTCLAIDFMKTVSSGFKHCTCLALPVLLLVKLTTAFTQQILPLPSCVIG